VPKPSDENNEVVASPKHDRRQRRDFTDEYKERILRELDACSERGQVGALLRREGLYSSQISDWRKQLEQGGRERLQAKRPGPKPSKDAKDKQIEQQLKRIAKLEKELCISKALIDLQVKAHEILGIALPRIEDTSEDDLPNSSDSATRRSR
jgi:transposase-like protein